MRYRDRREAGRYLAGELQPLASEHPLVVALPRGGVPVAYEIATALSAPLDVLAVRKLGAPANPEYGVGAVAEDGTAVLDARAAIDAGMTESGLRSVVDREVAELARRVRTYRGSRPPEPVDGRVVVLVDDGLATGLTDLAAVRAVRARGARRIVVAAPVGSAGALRRLAAEADEVVCPHVPRDFRGVGLWYEDFAPVADGEVVDLLHAAAPGDRTPREMTLDLGGADLGAILDVPPRPRGLVIFAHGSDSSRHSRRNARVARILGDAGFATLLVDLLTEDEARHRESVFDVALLSTRVAAATRWAAASQELRDLPIGYFGASTGAAAALRAAARLRNIVRAVVSRGGRPDLAEADLPDVTAPTLLIVGGDDWNVLAFNEQAAEALRCPKEISIVEGAGHLFEEPGALDAVAALTREWFERHLDGDAASLGRVA